MQQGRFTVLRQAAAIVPAACASCPALALRLSAGQTICIQTICRTHGHARSCRHDHQASRVLPRLAARSSRRPRRPPRRTRSRSARSTATRRSRPSSIPTRRAGSSRVEEINAAGGVLGKKLEVISRDDGGNPGDAVRVAEELVTREGVRADRRHVPVAHRPRGHRLRRAEEGVLPRRRAADRQDHLAERQPLHLPPARHRPTCRPRCWCRRRSSCQEEALGARLSELRVRPVGRGDLQGAAEEGAARRRVRRRAGAAARQGRCRRGRAGARRRQARRDLQRAVRRRPRQVRARRQHARRCSRTARW